VFDGHYPILIISRHIGMFSVKFMAQAVYKFDYRLLVH